jgi:hypothetical protein
LSSRDGKPLANLVMSLASYGSAKSVTGLSESPLYHYQYSSINKTLHDLAANSSDGAALLQKIYGLLKSFGVFEDSSEVFGLPAYLLQIDVCNAEKGSTPCFENRTQNYKANNQVVGNKPLSPGYAVSFVNLHVSAKNWSIPLCSKRVDLAETETACALSQLKMLLGSADLPFAKALTIVVSDSKYGNAPYLAPVHSHENLVSITRITRGRKVYSADFEPHTPNSQGAPQQYGEAYTLIPQDRLFCGTNKSGKYEKRQNSLFNLSSNDFHSEITTTSKGRQLRVEVHRWNNLKIRTTNGNSMKDKPLDICCVRIFDAQTNEPVFDKELWFAISGKRKDEISTQNGFLSYRQRYGIEPFFRFNKQNLFFQDYQTPDSQHFDNWGFVSLLATWLLVIAEEDIVNTPKKWQKYLPINQKAQTQERKQLTLSQAYNNSEKLFLSFDKTPFLPKVANKPHGRRKGEKQTKRTKYPIVKKIKKSAIKPKTSSKIPKPPD